MGAPETLAERIAEYAELGIETFILSGYPHLEEVYPTAKLLFPHLDIASASLQRSPVAPGRAGEAGGYALNRYSSDVATGPS